MLEIVRNFLKRLQWASKWISDYFWTFWWRFGVSSETPEIARFRAKSLGYSPWFWKWRIWLSAGNRSNLPETPPMGFQMHFRLLLDFWWRFGVSSEGPEIGRFRAKSQGYSQWFWKWWIWLSAANRSKLHETPPMCFQMDFQLLSGSFGKIGSEFRTVRNRPILSKKPGLWPIALKMADLVECWKSFETSWNASNILANVFKTTFRLVQEDLEWIPNGPKSADCEHKAWAIAHGFENGGFF